MSGFEIVGIVLGSIPLVISALEHYMDGVNTILSLRYYRRELNTLILMLKTEYVSLQNVCEKLLRGIAPDNLMEQMIDDPFGHLWSEPKMADQLRLRLWRSFGVFDDTVRDMKEAIQEIMEKLGIGPDGKVEWLESTSLKRHWRRLAFALQRSNYDGSLTRIRDGVASLQRLAILNVEMEPDRKTRSQSRLNRLVHTMSSSIYQALRSAMLCKCSSLHDVGLRLAPPSRTIIPEDNDGDVAKELRFRLAFSCASLSPVRRWKEMLLQMSDAKEKRSLLPSTAQAYPSKRVKFSVPLRTTTPDPSQPTYALQPVARQPCYINDLCEAIQRASILEHCGSIKDHFSSQSHEYGILVLDSPAGNEEWALVPLTHFLQNREGSSSSLLYGDKLRLGWVIACSVLQMHGTPWISDPPTHNDIYIVVHDGVPRYESAFVLKRLPDEPQQGQGQSDAVDPAPLPLSLGILLIEPILGQTMDALGSAPQDPAPSGLPQHYLDGEAATRLLGRVNTAGGPGYHDAVQQCLTCNSFPRSAAADSGVLQGDIFSKIVGPLEKDLRNAVS